MKTLLVTAVLTLASANTFAARLTCSFKGGTVLRENGTRVARSFQPRVLPAGQISLDMRNDEVNVYSMMNMNINRFGSKRCVDYEMREGFDCYRIYQGQYNEREFLLHVSTAAPRKTTLAMPTGMGNTQNDEYVCR